jgi:hypothetical protein
MQFAIDYQIYYPNENISSDVFSEAGRSYLRAADKNADVRIRKELNLGFIRPSLFVEIKNVFNYKWTNLDIIETASQEDRVKFINSGFENFPEKQNDGAPFPDQLNYNNLPRQIIFGISFSY